MTHYQTRPTTKVDQSSQAVFQKLASQPLSILCGRNNSGKSFVLRQLVQTWGDKASYLGPARHNNFNILSPYGPRPNRKNEKWNDLIRQLQDANQNVDNTPLNLQQAIAELSDGQRNKLLETLNELLGAETRILYTIPDNSMSQQYVNVDGFNLSFTSSGFRLIATLLTSLFDTDYTHFLIDEPELGLSPEVQGIFADWLLRPETRNEHLQHVEAVVLATHSPIFLDRVSISNNYRVEREGTDISITPLQSFQDLNSLQFMLLGNRFETLFLPSAIVLVEGKLDHAYLSSLIARRYPKSVLSIIHASGDGRIKEIVAIAKQMLGDISRSPYANRLLVVLDSIHGQGVVGTLKGQGVREENITIWSVNGIEYLYPSEILKARFGTNDIEVKDDTVMANGIITTKGELSRFVLERLGDGDSLPDELTSFLGRLETLLF